jgi:gas vesicle protein
MITTVVRKLRMRQLRQGIIPPRGRGTMSTTDFLCGFLAGATVGIAGTILFAPASGRETRQRIRDTANSGAQAVRDRATNLKQQASGVLDSGSQLVDRAKQEVTDAVNAGKQAFAEARTPKTVAAS